LIELVNEKPALAKRLVDAIEYRFAEVAIDPVSIYRKQGRDGLMDKLKGMSADKLRILIRQYEIPCGDLGKRRKPDMISLVCEYAHNTAARIVGTGEEAA
jgi:hypothetical protein